MRSKKCTGKDQKYSLARRASKPLCKDRVNVKIDWSVSCDWETLSNSMASYPAWSEYGYP